MPLDASPSVSHADAIAAAGARVSQLARSGDLEAPAIGLGRWRARDVVAHLGGVHRWAARILTTRSMDGPGFTKSKLHGEALCDWFDEGCAALVGAIAATDPEERCPNFNPGSRAIAAFWHRRQAHETTIHRWDLERALSGDTFPNGTVPNGTTGIDAALAVDGVEEYLEVFVRGRGMQTLTAPLVLATAEHDRCWSLRPAQREGRIDIAAGAAADATSRISGPAEIVLLHLWGRLPLDTPGITVGGDRAVAASFRG